MWSFVSGEGTGYAGVPPAHLLNCYIVSNLFTYIAFACVETIVICISRAACLNAIFIKSERAKRASFWYGIAKGGRISLFDTYGLQEG